jgi:hypothetical protein
LNNKESPLKTMPHYWMELTGTKNACCPVFPLYKADAKGVPKTTSLVDTGPGERLNLDTSGPYAETLK